MAYFKITYKVRQKRYSTILEAANRLEATKEFMDRQIGLLLSIEEVQEPLSWRLRKIYRKFNNPIKNKSADLEKLIALLEQISVMLDAGLPINFALKEVVQNEKDAMLKAIFSEILAGVESGKSFYEAAKPFEQQLGRLTLSMIRLGEETGRLAEELGHLAKILQEVLDNRRKFKKATRYPLFILVAMSIAFVVVVVMVIPQFEAFFKESNMELPLPTRFLLWIEHATMEYGPYILVGAVLVAAIISYLYSKKERVRLFLDRLLLKIFIIGRATYYAMLSRFLYIFRVLHDAGIPMIDSIKIANEVVDNSFLREQLRKIPAAIEEGRSLYQGFEESKLFENMELQMLRSGEMGGGLSRMLEKVNKIYKDRFEYIVDNIAVLLEPVLIAAIAGFVLVLALGIFLPMWNMIEVSG